jgi:tungstate transport system substrate-binding protein
MAQPYRSVVNLVLVLLFAFVALACGKSEPPGGRLLRLATSTSLKDSGFLEELLPALEKKTGYHVEVTAVQSRKAIEMMREGTADVAITHSPSDEQTALASGDVIQRTPFMHNEYVLVGPSDQASVIERAGDALGAMRAIAASGRKFMSRNDDSATHQRELSLWKAAGVTPDPAFITHANAKMGETLARASEQGAFTLSDRATFLAKHKELKLAIVFQKDDALKNTYSVLLPKPSSGARQNAEGARALSDFVVAPEVRAMIATFGTYGLKTLGEPLFTPEPAR